jgi:hypothetical protein
MSADGGGTPQRPFGAVLNDVRDGACHMKLTKEMENLVAAVRQTGRAGKITLTLEVKPVQKTNGAMVTVKDKITVSLPEFEQEETVMFTTQHNTMHRDNPQQSKLDLKVAGNESVDIETGEVKSA